MRSERWFFRAVGFTLIELLIVVAIIAILAAIAVPNFLEAQMRSKVVRVKADMRTARVGLEAYRVDYNTYLPDLGASDERTWARLTTPVSYLTMILHNPFNAKNMRSDTEERFLNVFVYGADARASGRHGWPADMRGAGLYYWVLSAGPDEYANLRDHSAWGDGQVWIQLDAGTGYLEILYDPTNGTKSSGDIIASNKRLY